MVDTRHFDRNNEYFEQLYMLFPMAKDKVQLHKKHNTFFLQLVEEGFTSICFV